MVIFARRENVRRPSGLGMPPAPQSAGCPSIPLGFGEVPGPAHAIPPVVSRSRVRTGQGGRPGAPKACP
jgi:hypothetical protein